MNAHSGRPRDPRIDEALTTHLVALLAERGLAWFSIDELAERSGVGKAAIYRRYRSREELVAAGYDRATVERVARLVIVNEYKRRQAAPGVRITPRAFGRDRRYPITSGFRR